MKQIIVTPKGLEAMKQELEQLKSVTRGEIADKLKTALAFGDLSENSEYDSAKNEQAIVESRILELENMIKNCIVLSQDVMQTEIVDVGLVVEVKNLNKNVVKKYTIVSTAEADSDNGKISDESPMGYAVMGHKVGDIVTFDAPSGPMKLQILSISMPEDM